MEKKEYNYYPFFKNWITCFETLTNYKELRELLNLIFVYWEEDRIPQLEEIKSEKVKKIWKRDFIDKIKTVKQRQERNRRYYEKNIE